MPHLLSAIVGLLLLAFGWKLFWVFVGVMGFVAGLQAADWILGPQPFWIIWTAGLICGIIGAGAAVLFQRLAIVLGGFVAGSFLVSHLMALMGYHAGELILLVGGVLGGVTLFLMFDWALVILSSLVGATLVIDALGRPIPYEPLWLLVGAATGFLFQANRLMASRKGGP